jgi:hypothetical protein
MRAAPRALLCAVIGAMVTVCAPRLLQAQDSGARTLHASVSKLSRTSAITRATLSAGGIQADGQLVTADRVTVIASALASLFDVPVSLSRISFTVDNALDNLSQYRAFEFVAPRLYDASRVYRLTWSVIEF